MRSYIRYITCCIIILLTIEGVALNIVSEKSFSDEEANGFFTVRGNATVKIPFGKEFLGYETLTIGNDEAIFYLQNYKNGKLLDKEICWSNSSLIYIANYNNDVLDGVVTLFPNEIYTCNFTVKNGILSGTCQIYFTPFKYYSSKCYFNTSDEFSPEYEKKAITSGPPEYTLSSIGEYRNGKKYNGEFLEIKQKGIYRLVSVSQYKDGELMGTSKETIYKIPPRILMR